MSQSEDKKKKDEKKDEKKEKEAEKPVCTNASVAEHSRLDQEDEPCDDGRAG